MKHFLLLFAIIFFSASYKAQSLQYNTTSLPATIGTDGLMKSTTGVTLGSILPGGVIKNAANVPIGNIANDGTITNMQQDIIGYVLNDGTVKDANQAVIGKVLNSGVVQNAGQNTIGNAPGVDKKWTAVCYFFYKVN